LFRKRKKVNKENAKTTVVTIINIMRANMNNHVMFIIS